MAGFVLKNTLSDNGGVTRGICKMDEYNNLTEIVETSNIVKNAEGAEADGVKLDTESLVSALVSSYKLKKDNLVKAQTKLSWKQESW